MSPYLNVECEFVSPPSTVSDRVEQATWCRFRVSCGDQVITRLWDKRQKNVREHLCIPAFPIVEWIVENWWILLNEACKTYEIPTPPNLDEAKYLWLQHHCLRAADSALLLPALHLYRNGSYIVAEWKEDKNNTLPHMTGEFLGSGSAELDIEDTLSSLAEFVEKVLKQARNIDDERVTDVVENWDAIQSADSEEIDFCMSVGLLGINPYSQDELTDEIADFISRRLHFPSLPYQQDFLETVPLISILEQWEWVEAISTEFHLGALAPIQDIDMPAKTTPYNYGYSIASHLRKRLKNGVDPIESLEDTASSILKRELRLENRNHLTKGKIRGLVGGQMDLALVVCPQKREDATRFALAQGFFHALRSCAKSQRLITGAYTWEQQAARAFAAEFLMPQEALRQYTDIGDDETIHSLASAFRVSEQVVRHQLENAGIDIPIS